MDIKKLLLIMSRSFWSKFLCYLYLLDDCKIIKIALVIKEVRS